MIKEINKDRLRQMKESNVWSEECPVHFSRLRIIEVAFWNFEEEEKSGELIMLDEVADSVLQIFKELYQLRFPVENMIRMEDFGGDDVQSMQANNSSGFNGRKIARTDRWSSHAYGVAIDINPVQNPYLLLNENKELVKVIPSEGKRYLDRSYKRKGMVEEIVPVFARHGFTDWGGTWEAKPDFHHFQFPWENIRLMFSG